MLSECEKSKFILFLVVVVVVVVDNVVNHFNDKYRKEKPKKEAANQ